MSLTKMHKRSILKAFENEERLLQEQEEAALFSTMREISRQVHREAEPFIRSPVKPVLTFTPEFDLPFDEEREALVLSAAALLELRRLVDRILDTFFPWRAEFYSAEEEASLFSTIEEISRQVHQEAAAAGLAGVRARVRAEPAYVREPEAESGLFMLLKGLQTRLDMLLDRISLLMFEPESLRLYDEKVALIKAMKEMSRQARREAAATGMADINGHECPESRYASRHKAGLSGSVLLKSLLKRLDSLLDWICYLMFEPERLQLNDEEAALFSTVQEVSRQVYRETREKALQHDQAGSFYLSMLAPRNPTPLKDALLRSQRMTAIRTSIKARNPGWERIYRYIDSMDEDLNVVSRIIDRNRVVSMTYGCS
jgi:hypothetical protein